MYHYGDNCVVNISDNNMFIVIIIGVSCGPALHGNGSIHFVSSLIKMSDSDWIERE